jgi:hypothetical protein
MTRLLGLIAIVVGISIVFLGTSPDGRDAATDIEAWTLIGSGSVLLGRSVQFRTDGRLIVVGLILAAVAIAVSVWWFSGSLGHVSYAPLAGLVLLGIAGFVVGLGVGTWPRREPSTRVY